MCILQKWVPYPNSSVPRNIRIFQFGRSHLDPTWCKKKYQEYSAGYKTADIYYVLICFPTVSYIEVTYSSTPNF
jgi:hypothetical protein